MCNNMKKIIILFSICFIFFGCKKNQENIPGILSDEYIKSLKTIDICQLRNGIYIGNPIVKIRALYTGWNGEDMHLTGVDSCQDFKVSLAESPYFYFVENSNRKDEIIKTNNLDLFRKIKRLPKDKLILEIIGIYETGGCFGHLNSYNNQIIPLEIKVVKLIQE